MIHLNKKLRKNALLNCYHVKFQSAYTYFGNIITGRFNVFLFYDTKRLNKYHCIKHIVYNNQKNRQKPYDFFFFLVHQRW